MLLYFPNELAIGRDDGSNWSHPQTISAKISPVIVRGGRLQFLHYIWDLKNISIGTPIKTRLSTANKFGDKNCCSRGSISLLKVSVNCLADSSRRQVVQLTGLYDGSNWRQPPTMSVEIGGKSPMAGSSTSYTTAGCYMQK